jgi:hypothetical protein
MANIESVYTYEGTGDTQTLVTGGDITGFPAFGKYNGIYYWSSIMNLAAIFVVICGVFVAVVLALVVWLILTGLRDEVKHKGGRADTDERKHG